LKEGISATVGDELLAEDFSRRDCGERIAALGSGKVYDPKIATNKQTDIPYSSNTVSAVSMNMIRIPVNTGFCSF
jgi:hypothetical protein